MRRLIPVAVVVAALSAFTAVALAEPTGNFNEGQGQTCTRDADGPQRESVTCEGTISGLGNNPVTVFVVLRADAGCSNDGNDDIPGQRRFISPGFTPAENGSVDYTVTGAIRCHGNQIAFILSPVDLEAYACTSGAPRFNKQDQQTNSNCTLIDTENNVPVT